MIQKHCCSSVKTEAVSSVQARHEVEANAVTAEGDSAQKSQLSEALIKVLLSFREPFLTCMLAARAAKLLLMSVKPSSQHHSAAQARALTQVLRHPARYPRS